MNCTHRLGCLTAREEFLYPDTPLSPLPATLRLPMACNARPGIQLLLQTDQPQVQATLSGSGFQVEWFSLRAVPVEYNSGDGSQQGGAMVLEQRPAQKPAYAARLAPFQVYDCLVPVQNGRFPVENGVAALYFCLVPDKAIRPGIHLLELSVDGYLCRIEVVVYPVSLPEKCFSVTNWFSLEAMARCHGLAMHTQAYYEMVRRYARLLHRMHQNIFFIELDRSALVCRDPVRFDFEPLQPVIQCFFDEGLDTLEIGPLLSRGFLLDGMPDMFTAQFRCAMAPELPLESPEGYAFTLAYLQALAAFLRQNGWEKNLLFHIHDEPDIHFRTQADLDARRRQYYLAASLVRRYFPGARIIEAVDSPRFYGGVDVWSPSTVGYEKNKAAFDHFTALGEEVWTYVCCGPQGDWLNRFLDLDLIKGRLLYWGCAKNRLSGFLHWGFNQFPAGMDPFKATSCPNPTGLGTNFPCGDAFLVYPGSGEPWPGMRLEAQRRGVEDATLLEMLRQKDPAAHDRLVETMFQDNRHYQKDPAALEQAYEQLLALLGEAGTPAYKTNQSGRNIP